MHVWIWAVLGALLTIWFSHSLFEYQLEEKGDEIWDPMNPRKLHSVDYDSPGPDESDSGFLDRVVRMGMPVVLRNLSFARDWKAMNWNADYLFSRCGKNSLVSGVKSSHSRTFLHYEAGFPLDGKLGIHPGHRILPAISLEGLFQRIDASPHSKEFTYFSRTLSSFCSGLLLEDLRPSDLLFVRRNISTQQDKGTEFGEEEVNIWIGGKDVEAGTHYDAQHNFFFQSFGEKRFLLSSPSSLYEQYLFPRLHPSDRQSRVDWESFIGKPVSLLDKEFPRHRDIPLISATLSPGDILYIPPFWFHRVQALSSISISANFWSDDISLRYVRRLLQNPVPFIAGLRSRNINSREAELLGLALWVRGLAESLLPLSSERSLFYEDLVLQLRIALPGLQRHPVCPALSQHPHLKSAVSQEVRIALSRVQQDTLQHIDPVAAPFILPSLIQATTTVLLPDPQYAADFLLRCCFLHNDDISTSPAS